MSFGVKIASNCYEPCFAIAVVGDFQENVPFVAAGSFTVFKVSDCTPVKFFGNVTVGFAFWISNLTVKVPV